MHEFSVSQAIYNAVMNEARKRGAERILKVELSIGELTLLNPEQVVFWLGILFEGGIGEGAEIVVEEISSSIFCENCFYRGGIRAGNEDHFLPVFRCPRCGSGKIKIERGRECYIKAVEIRGGDVPCESI